MTDSSARQTVAQRKTVVFSLAFLVALMIVLCLPTLKMGLWEDELIQINSASQPGLLAVWLNMYGRLTDSHPPLSYILLYPFLHFFGVNDIAVRMPFLICGLLLVPAMYWLGRTAHSHKVGLLAAFFAAVSPYENYFACQSRSYSLSTLLVAVSLALFCRLMNGHKRAKKATFVGFVLAATAVYYTEYSAGVLLPALGVAVLLISYRYWLSPETKMQAFTTLKTGLGAIFLAGLLVIPWLPSLIRQLPHPPITNPTPLVQWPFVFSYNLVMMMPIHAIIGIPLEILAVLSLLFWALWKCGKLTLPGALTQMKSSICSLPAPQIVLLCALLIPCCLIGYIVPWFLGYYRYIYPYSPAGWAVLAILACQLWGAMSRPKAAAWLIAVVAVNIAYLCWFDSRPQSAMRTLAKEASSGEYDNTVVLLVSDIELGPSFNYYLPEKDRRAHNIFVAGYPRWSDCLSIILIPEISRDFHSTEMLDEVERHIQDLQEKGGWKYLAFVSELDPQIELLTTPNIPRMQRITALRNFMDKNFKKVSTKEYAGVTESVTVSKYQLAAHNAKEARD